MTDWTDDELRRMAETDAIAAALLREQESHQGAERALALTRKQWEEDRRYWQGIIDGIGRLGLAEKLRVAENERDAAIKRAEEAERMQNVPGVREVLAGLERERDALGVQNQALREAVRKTHRGCDPQFGKCAMCEALALDLPRATAIAEAARRVCEAADARHDHIVEIGQTKQCAICDALAEWREAKEGR